jgi:hypothetical protein
MILSAIIQSIEDCDMILKEFRNEFRDEMANFIDNELYIKM